MPNENQLNNNEEITEEESNFYPNKYATKNVKFKQGLIEDFSHVSNFANNTFYTASDAGIMRLGNLVYLHSIICLTQNQYDYLQWREAINPYILYFIVEDGEQSDFNYIQQGIPNLQITGGSVTVKINEDNWRYYAEQFNSPSF